MKVMKRDGSEVIFDVQKIITAMSKANKAGPSEELSDEQICAIAALIETECTKLNRPVSVEEIQDMVEHELMVNGAFETARRYIKYRYNRTLARQANTTDAKILSLINNRNEEVKEENANKNPTVNSVQRDYVAGEVSRDLTRRLLLPKNISDAHDEGIIHFHDQDFFAFPMHNCCLINLEDMLQNGTVISGTTIERPRSFATACNIATQIIAQVASSQYGGQSVTLSHLAPFVDVSRKKIRKQVEQEFSSVESVVKLPDSEKEKIIQKITEDRVRDEIKRGIQIIQYQVITLMTTNGLLNELAVVKAG